MEAALIKLKQRNDELTAKTRDLPDGQPQPSPSPTALQCQADFDEIKDQVQQQAREHNERIVEMVRREFPNKIITHLVGRVTVMFERQFTESTIECIGIPIKSQLEIDISKLMPLLMV